ncbi:MAG TPA: hypothetical protein VM261_10555 [Kofleriaceae bacterium]|nr:hypothetical protein [Kofleriaceae bacterium]
MGRPLWDFDLAFANGKVTGYDDITYLRTWIGNRLAWLDAQANLLPGACP